MTDELELESLDVEIQRRLLDRINSAHRLEDLGDLPKVEGVQAVGDLLLKHRNRLGPYGFRHVRELAEGSELNSGILTELIKFFGYSSFGKWDLLPYSTQRPDGTLFPIAHAAVLCTGKVLFLPSWEPTDTVDTVLWNPSDEVNPQFNYPANQPTEYLFCAGHSFLSDGQLLAVGGGGNYISNAIKSGWRFNPNGETWAKTKGSMKHARWYPTAVTLNNPARVFVASGYDVSAVEMYYEATDTFVEVTGPGGTPAAAARNFPETYPGLHLLPGGEIFFSKTGWHGPDDPSTKAAYFRFNSTSSGEWVDIETLDPMNHPDRTEGMSVLLLNKCGGARVLVVCGGLPDDGGRDSVEMIHLSTLHPNWPHPMHIPEERLNVNAVLLPDGKVFVLGGMNVENSPCRMYDPDAASMATAWSEMASLKYRRQYHSVAALLPNGKVMTTGGDTGNTIGKKTTIEIFSPPYLFHGPPPKITNAPTEVQYGETFRVKSPDCATIDKVVLMRPAAVTHHTDSEQRRVELSYTCDGKWLDVRAPGGHNAHNIAPHGYYMLFLLNDKGVPSEACFLRLHA